MLTCGTTKPIVLHGLPKTEHGTKRQVKQTVGRFSPRMFEVFESSGSLDSVSLNVGLTCRRRLKNLNSTDWIAKANHGRDDSIV